jgi:subtilase family serine protease
MSHGFEVNDVAKSRMIIEFSGSAEQVQQAFHTPIDKFEVNGEEHWANRSAGDSGGPGAGHRRVCQPAQL